MSKATALRRLQQAGFCVPDFVVIPADVFGAFQSALPGSPSMEEVLRAPMPASLAGPILELSHQLSADNLAVRSSMTGEDSGRHSFAGQLDSFLNVPPDHDAVLVAVKACWASAYSDRAMAYRKQHNLSAGKVVMEVIVQAMVPADASGVIFTADPVARDPRRMLISVTQGLGDALVQGQVAGETVQVDRETYETKGEARLLAKEQLVRLISLGKEIEALFGAPQDIEFAIAKGEIFVLQSRPITTSISTMRMLWDNSNITESYSGVTTPLTFSVIRGAYAQVYRQFLALMGVQHTDDNVLRNLLGLYNGQVYYQLLNWYEALGWLPAFEQNRRFMEQMMGVKQPANTEPEQRTSGVLALLGWGLRLISLHLTSAPRVQAFMDHFNEVLAEYKSQDFEGMTPHQLNRAYLDLETRVLGEWRAPILNDFFAMIFFGALRRLSETWFGSSGALHNDLLAGEGGIESMEPARRVQALAGMVRNDQALGAVFRLDAAQALDRLCTQPEFSSFKRSLDDYLKQYGDRCMNELKLEEPNLRDDPLPLIRFIAAAAERPVETFGNTDVRAMAEARLVRLPWTKRLIFKWALQNTRTHIRNRENMRFARSRLFGLLRGIFNAVGHQWTDAGVLVGADDIFYLSVQEVFDFVNGTAITQNLAGLVALRRCAYDAHKRDSRPLPDRFETFGVPYLDTPRDLIAPPLPGSHTLVGTGCCSGQVTGRARIVRSVDGMSSLGGDILAAERTDPGWIFLFPSASGILVERGSPLSHSAIVAREMGKPIIVNIPNLTSLVKTGDQLEMDGGRGIVQILPG